MDDSVRTLSRPATGRRLRVLQISLNLGGGGLERLIADIVRKLNPDRFESHVMCMDFFGVHAEGLETVARLHKGDPLPRHTMLWPRPLIRQIRTIAPDVVHAHSGIWYKATFAARRAGVPRVVYTEHGRPHPETWHGRLFDRLAARQTNAVVAVSERLAGQLRRELVRDGSKVHAVLNGVDTRQFRPRTDDGALREELGLAPEAPIIASAGRFERVKGYDVMLEAFAILRSTWSAGPAPLLVVAGTGSELDSLRARAAESGLTDSVRFLGWRDDLRALYRASAIFSLASRSEGTAVGLLEAMSSGVCPVVTDVGGNADVLGAALAHCLVPSENPGELAAAWERALRDEVSRQSDGEAARVRVQARFSLDRMVAQYERIYAGD